MSGLSRREFLQGSLTAAAALGLLAEGRSDVTRSPAPVVEIVDTHVCLGRWPFRRISGDEPAELVAQLRAAQVVQAWAGSLDGLLHKDIGAVNARLAEDCRTYGDGMLVPFGTVNPTLPDWEEDLRRCHERHRMPGIRLHPNYHGYTLDDPQFVRLLERAAQRQLIVQLVAWMEDERHHYRLMPVPAVSLAPLADKVRAIPGLRLIVANGFRSAGEASLRDLLDLDQVFFDFAKLDVINGLGELLERVPAGRVVFGSFSPLFYFDSALLKLSESVLAADQIHAICAANARRLLVTAG